MSAEQPKGSWRELQGFFKGKTSGARLSIDEIGDVIADAAVAAGMSGMDPR